MQKTLRSGGIGVVIIGRNEGDRLIRCLDSLASLDVPMVYVDSGSTDGSPARVRSAYPRVQVHALDPSRPFSAARARNEGAQVLQGLIDPPEFIQFIDGDCVMAPGWLDAARLHLSVHEDCSAVIGVLTEMHPEASVYNRLCAMEWNSAAGDVEDCGAFGGISVVRARVFQQLGGFNASVIAGEDSELAVRMKLAGHRVTKLAQPMASHDAGMTRFSEFWRRAVRSGHAIGQRYALHGRGPMKDCAKDLRSVQIWGFGLPLVAVVFALVTKGWGLLVWPLGLLWLFSRVTAYRKGMGDGLSAAALYAGAILITKYAQVRGLITYWARSRRQAFHIIEYK